MQLDLKRLQHEFAITFVVVTHDQEEALVMTDRIALMRNGRIEQIGTAVELYEMPQSRFVADYIGSTNLIEGTAHGSRVQTRELGAFLGLPTPTRQVKLSIRQGRSGWSLAGCFPCGRKQLSRQRV